MDRTQAFIQECSRQVQLGVQPVPVVLKNAPARNPTQEAKLFAKMSADVSRKIHLASQRLERLTGLVKRQGVFNDPTEEINQLAARIKTDTKFLKNDLDDLQLYLEHNKRQVGAGSTSAEGHSQSMVESMQYQLVNTASTFKQVLETRQSNVKAQRDRRGLFGRHNRNNALGRPYSNPYRLRNKQSSNNLETSNQEEAPQTDGLPRPNGIQAPLTPLNGVGTGAHLYGSQGNGLQNLHSQTFDDQQEPEFLIQPQQSLMEEHSYLNSRVEAVTNIETHIHELGNIFSRFSEMVAQSQYTVDRIDDNVNTAHDSLLAGRDELMRYWQSSQGNFWLMAKISFVLLFFLTFFIMFIL
mmetsp:Transcript_14945/g.17475  ORF Transcript_14945/g.17475 Transcript_14945/m.17475 type:complete len:354 (-) Transcript_14945:168-1229(-)|eukprot:CAMPEP_0204832078 /NCGR_PEP_ID=MMETSP1346-20131115/12668_1 /ASSEMBLY_ACC=CAM_ASM_000771 /TAXON_ID=215587 /ORGANISM="Aplanochytrium stocchinoi, Strain GSBS06" /LENGTH=353 /DNA_ID=CAMNT_0051963669 /DNA_START=292 /DNA_END=1353 /DNA_ORIENTATION=-